jgi:transmembrane sensor
MEGKKNINSETGNTATDSAYWKKIKTFNEWYASFDPNEEIVVNSIEAKEIVKGRMQSRLLDEIGDTQRGGLKLIRFTNTYWKAAAAIAFFIILSSAFFYSTNVWRADKTEFVWNERATRLGEKIEIVLTDGSKIMLNAGSKIKFPQKFVEGKQREIILEGEAFFDVVHKNEQAFIVHSGDIITRDIGTKFNVKAFENDKNVTISLIEGKVEVSVPGNAQKPNDKKYLLPLQQLNYNRAANSLIIQNCDQQEAIGWMNNLLVFRKEPLEQVALRLERNFGVKFEFSNSHISEKELTANFRNEPFLTVAEAIKKVTGLNYKTVKENNHTVKIIFF